MPTKDTLRHLWVQLCLGLCLMSGSGCALNRDLAISHTYSVSSLEKFSPHKLVYRAHVAEDFEISRYDTIILSDVNLHASEAHRALAQRAGVLLQDRLRSRLVQIFPDKRIVLSADDQKTSKALYLHCTLAEFSPGNGFVRWFLGLGLGSAKIQVEGKGMEPNRQGALFEFARKRSYDGYPIGGLNIFLLSNEWAVEQSIKGLANDIAAFVGSL